ncbi:Lrp/AsnC family transcriptional regulator [Curvivirga sp.]|uniref:Lrp/AsnC family transcriptional regulator n=1 Tax=Curvivirga sp. TaxID=2856848 RepID=UPI003B595325
MKKSIDEIDRRILLTLSEDARKSWRELGEELGVSAPTIRDRVARLQDLDILKGFTIDMGAEALGYELQAIVRFKPFPGKVKQLEQQIQAEKRVIQCDKITGDDAFVARILLRSISELDNLLDAFTDKASTHTSIVKSSPVTLRKPPI